MSHKIIHNLSIVLIILLSSCSSDGNLEPDENSIGTCSDSILNGDEEGVDCGGSCNTPCETDTSLLKGSLVGELILKSDRDYTLEGGYIIESGSSLIIPPGTNITANPGENVYILVKSGADLVINGTSTNPVTIGSNEPWGGIILAGNSKIDATLSGTANIGAQNFEYGGNDLSENSGTIEYLIIKNAGIGSYGAISLFGIGSGTTLKNIALFNSNGYGIKYYGGTVSTSNIYLENNLGFAIAWSLGWSGNQNNTYIANNTEFTAMLSANGPNNKPTLNNLTAITDKSGTAFIFNEQSGANITGLSLTGFETSFLLNDDVIAENIQVQGLSVDTNNSYENPSNVTQANFEWAGNLIGFN